MDPIQLIALSLGLAWASGINLYAAVAALGILGATGHVDLPPGLEVTQHPAVIGAAVLMYCVEFFADKVPGVDSAWDGLHGFIRIPAAAVLAAAAVYHVDPAIAFAAALLGGAVGTASYTLKAGSRLALNASPEPFSNITASLVEDIAVFSGVLLALFHPPVLLGALAVFAAVIVWVGPRLWRGLRRAVARLRPGRRTSTPARPATVDGGDGSVAGRLAAPPQPGRARGA